MIKASILRAYLRMTGFGKCLIEEELFNNTLSANILCIFLLNFSSALMNTE